MTARISTIQCLGSAVETRDSAAVRSCFGDNAVLTVVDSIIIPSKSRTITGNRDIGAFLDDVCSLDMSRTIDSDIVDAKTLACIERCQHADGTRVIASNTAVPGPNRIVRQTIVRARDS